MEQRTEEWYKAHLGIVTGSELWRIAEVLKSGKDSAEWDKYRDEKLCERITGLRTEHFTTYDMQWGIDHEDEAREQLSKQLDVKIKTTGLLPIITGFAASPDGYCEINGEVFNVEIKCPKTITHISTIVSGEAKKDYQWQMDAETMALEKYLGKNLSGSIFCSYDPRIKLAEKRLFIKRYSLNETTKSYIIERVTRFLKELDELESKFYGF